MNVMKDLITVNKLVLIILVHILVNVTLVVNLILMVILVLVSYLSHTTTGLCCPIQIYLLILCNF